MPQGAGGPAGAYTGTGLGDVVQAGGAVCPGSHRRAVTLSVPRAQGQVALPQCCSLFAAPVPWQRAVAGTGAAGCPLVATVCVLAELMKEECVAAVAEGKLGRAVIPGAAGHAPPSACSCAVQAGSAPGAAIAPS